MIERRTTSHEIGARRLDVVDSAIDLFEDVSAQLAEIYDDPARQAEARLAEWRDLAWEIYADAGIPFASERPSQYWILPDDSLTPVVELADYRDGYGHVFASGVPEVLGLTDDAKLVVAGLLMQFAHVVDERLAALGSIEVEGVDLRFEALGLMGAVIQAERMYGVLVEYIGVDPLTATTVHPEGRASSDGSFALRASARRSRDATDPIKERSRDKYRILAPIARAVQDDYPLKTATEKAAHLRKRLVRDGCPGWPGGAFPRAGTLRNHWDDMLSMS